MNEVGNNNAVEINIAEVLFETLPVFFRSNDFTKFKKIFDIKLINVKGVEDLYCNYLNCEKNILSCNEENNQLLPNNLNDKFGENSIYFKALYLSLHIDSETGDNAPIFTKINCLTKE